MPNERFMRHYYGASGYVAPDQNDTSHLKAHDFYRVMTTQELLLLRDAFRADITDATRLSTVSFCEQRIDWIEHELSKRTVS